jgi:arylformamidase
MNSSSYIYLSHLLSEETQGYGGKADFKSFQTKSIAKGDSCNQSEWHFNNHIGTHIDAPFHFSSRGKTLDQYPAEFWIFQRPQLLEVKTAASEIMTVGNWCNEISTETDLLMLRTGFEKYRGLENYWAHNPGLSPELGLWLREKRPSIRVLGLDFMSITSFENRPLGKLAHQAFLHESKPGNPLLVIEDMHLSELKLSPKKIVVSPMRVKNADGGPVTVVAEI